MLVFNLYIKDTKIVLTRIAFKNMEDEYTSFCNQL